MATFNLSSKTTLDSGITIYSYESTDMSVKFHFHPTKAWNFVCTYASENVSKFIYASLLNCFIDKAISQHEYKGGFDEAILVLNF
jgi:hypothetical protein